MTETEKIYFHSKSVSELRDSLKTDQENGLSSKEAEERLEKLGPNKLPEAKEKSKLLLLLEQFNDPVIYILIAAAIVNSIVAEPKDALVIGFVVILNTYFN